MTLEKRIEQLEFQVQLLFNNTDIDRYLFETNVTKQQYKQLMDLMDIYCQKISNGQAVHHATFEREVYQIVPEHNFDYHFCELIAKLFMEDGRWEDVFPALYGDMPKFQQPTE